MKDKKIIDDRYIKLKSLGSGGEGIAYLVLEKDKDTQLELVCKIIEQKKSKDVLKYKEDKEFQTNLQEKVRMFKKIASISSPYIIRCIREGNGPIKKNNEIIKIRNYFIFEYAPQGDLWKIINIAGGFGERYSKVIFKKILLGVQALHKAGIYHLDLKIDNIVIDNNYNPKICDFGYATDKQGKLKDTKGTSNFMPLQKKLKQEYLGEKADIFSLGCILFLLVVGGYCFTNYLLKEEIYQFVIKKNKEEYFQRLAIKYNEINFLSKEFKDLHFKMIAYEEDDRPENIEAILEDNWFDEIKFSSDENQKELEDEVKAKFIEKLNKINNSLKKRPHLLDKEGYATSSKNKNLSKEEEEYEYFKPNFTLENKNIKLNGEFYIRLLGNFNYCTFMNSFVNIITTKYKNKICFITDIKENYKCNIEFQKDEEDEEDNEENVKDLKIGLHLYQSGNEELILRFLRKSGDLHEYNEKVLDLFSLV